MSVLSRLDMTTRLKKDEYVRELAAAQARLNHLFRRAREARVPVVLVFEGWDAAGKGGTIRRMSSALDPRAHRVISIAAPNDEERARHYLWRFWRRLPRAGRWVTFDRSWYGRVLVERVEDFATEAEWRRAYGEINDFESQLVEFGTVVLKFWLHITPDEQERRFKARLQVPHKRWKLTTEDWRNRKRWDDYEAAVDDMVALTSTDAAPWHLIPANDKRTARVATLQKMIETLDAALTR